MLKKNTCIENFLPHTDFENNTTTTNNNFNTFLHW